MTDFIFSSLSNGQTVSFNAASDVLIFGSVSASAISVAPVTGGVSFTLSGKTVTLSGVSVPALTSSNISLAGAVFVVGDNTTTTDVDDLGQGTSTTTGPLVTVPGSGNDYILGLGGADYINGQDGADFINGGAGNDTITIDADEAAGDTYRGGADNDSINGTAANEGFTAFGDNGNDTIVVGTGSDSINGNAGDDSVSAAAGAAGSDTIRGGAGNDVITYSANVVTSGSVSINGDLGNDTLTAGAAGTYTINGGAGNDSIVGAAGTDAINGNAGNDTIGDAAGVDTVRGGADNDSITLAADSSADLAYGDNGNDTFAFTGANGADTVFGGAGDDSIVLTASTDGITATGEAGADSFTVATGDSGDHSLTGGAGADTYTITLNNHGAGGDDDISISDYASEDNIVLTTTAAVTGLTFTINSSTVTISEAGGASADTLTITTSGSDTIAGTFNSVAGIVGWNTSSTAATLTGGANADVLLSDSAGDSIDGGAGADSIVGGAGNDTISAGTGSTADTVDAGSGGDQVTITNATQAAIKGGTGTDTLIISSSVAETYTFDGAVANNQIEGFETITVNGSGAGTLVLTFDANYGGGTGTDIVADSTVVINAAGSGSSTNLSILGTGGVVDINATFSITGGSGADTIDLTATDNNHTISGGDGTDQITGAGGADSLSGGAGADTLSGAAGNDTLIGGDGNDTLIGGAGNDSLSGGAGADQYRISHVGAANIDTILAADFSVATGGVDDVLGLTAGTFTGGSAVTAGDGTTDVSAGASAFSLLGSTGSVSIAALTTATVLKLTSTSGTTFASAIGTASATTGNNAAIITTVWYDDTNDQAVIGYVASTNTTLNSADTFVEAARIGMTAADYANFDADNLLFF